ncbi:hypothetical protein EVAR_26015_1 [Eumeta japonica]|uniref:Uncharacterized protein n=1 Tax=Eumeta variegata TaxID=151549 RepID=A0A4C1VT01_EUMVA|nr:hypothetical protein EVAR_26015_1 [Eumeta japonica]
MKEKTSVSVMSSSKSPKRMKNLVNGANGSLPLADDGSSEETDDDVSLSKFGVHNFSDSSNETVYPLNNSIINGRSFTPRSSENLWTKPKNTSTFCVTKNLNKINNVNDNIFRKPAFNKYQKLVKDDSDSDLDESISCLSIGSPKKKTVNTNSVFSLRKFNATPSFVAPTVMPLSQRRPLISPSKLGHGTSWVAGGYWGGEGNRQIFNINGSRSSSQSSGFESQTSSLNQRNVFSQPPSREESVCGEPDGQNVLLDRFHNCNVNSFSTLSQNPQNFGSPNSPVYPQMRYDSHVHIPQPRLAAHHSYVSYAQHQFVQNGTFKTPGRSGLIKLPQVNSMSH